MNLLHFPSEILLHITSFIPSEELGGWMRSSRLGKALGEESLRIRLRDLIVFWRDNCARGSEETLGKMILRKWEVLYTDLESTGFSVKRIRAVYKLERLAWSVLLSLNIRPSSLVASHSSGKPWPILIKEMGDLDEDEYIERKPLLVLTQLRNVNIAANTYSGTDNTPSGFDERIRAVKDHNPAIVGMGRQANTLSIYYVSQAGKVRKWPFLPNSQGKFNYNDIVDLCLIKTLRQAKSEPRIPLIKAETLEKKRMCEAEEIAVQSLKKLRKMPTEINNDR